MTIATIKSLQEYRDVVKSSTAAIIDFYETSSSQHREIFPAYEWFADNHDRVRFYKLDVSKVKDVAQEAGINASPTFVSYRGGKKVEELSGGDDVSLECFVKALATDLL
ncbi:thioredoxin-like protein [Gloeopeniophorella convolvens]|nr:thioredoxin-like protein [Gloeopeniophorella convolvens]